MARSRHLGLCPESHHRPGLALYLFIHLIVLSSLARGEEAYQAFLDTVNLPIIHFWIIPGCRRRYLSRPERHAHRPDQFRDRCPLPKIDLPGDLDLYHHRQRLCVSTYVPPNLERKTMDRAISQPKPGETTWLWLFKIITGVLVVVILGAIHFIVQHLVNPMVC
jgi:hypothetical protein